MGNERRRGSSRDRTEPDKTIPQSGDEADDAGFEPDATMIQRSRVKPASPGDTSAQGSLDNTVVEPSQPSRPAKVKSASGSDVKGKIFAGRFEVIEKLGEGGMGVVYRAKDREIEGREIALKVLRPRFSRSAQFRELFFREIHAAQGFVSEHVVQVRDTGKAADGTLFLTMDLVDGEPLDAVILRESSLNERHALEVARQTLVALASGHDQGFVHRDIKPSNIMLTRRVAKSDENPFGVGVRVLDFGIAGLTAQMEEGQVIGTPRYMSPEQVQGQRLDGRSDLFSVAIVLYEMLSGSRPFEGDTADELRTAILETNVTPLITNLENLSDPIRKILKKALQKNRDKRFQSAVDFAHAIEKSRAFREKRGTPAWVSGMLVLTMAGAGAEGWLIWDQRKQYDALERQVGGKSGDNAKFIDGLRAEHQAKLDRVAKELEEMRGDMNLAIAAKDTAELKVEQIQGRFDKEVRDRKDLVQERRDLASQLLDVQNRLKETEVKLNNLGRKDLLPVVAAKFFDRVVRLIEGGSPQEALAYLEARKGKGDVDIPVGEGAAHVSQVLEAAAALDLAAKVLLPAAGESAVEMPEGDERRKALEDYRRGARQLEQAKASIGAFELESTNWIDRKAELGNEDPIDRLGDFERVRAGLAARAGLLKVRIDEMNVALAGLVDEERAQLLKLTHADDPKPLIEHLSNFPGDLEQLSGLIDRLGADTEKQFASGGRLNLESLARATSLQQWGEFLSGEGTGVAGKGADTFRWLWAARNWHNGEDLAEPTYAFMNAVPKMTDTVPHTDWRAQLALQRLFLRNIATFLVDGQGAAVYRQQSVATGKHSWYHELLQTQEGATDRGEIIRKRVDDAGAFGRPQSISVSLRNGVFLIADKPTLDVRANGEHISVAQWQPELVAELPAQNWSRGMNHGRFRAGIEQGLPCLVIDAGDTKFWFSPGYGLVRKEIVGRLIRELCYSARVR